MKTIILGDTHGRPYWKKVVKSENPDRVIFLGDYFDSKEGHSATEQIRNYREIIHYKVDHPNTILLVGNHDLHYWPGTTERYSGYQSGAAHEIMTELNKTREFLQIAHVEGDLLLTHAGVSPIWLDETFDQWSEKTMVHLMNKALVSNPSAFNFRGLNPYGDSPQAGPTWIRPMSLLMANREREISNVYRQVVGHTRQGNLDLKDQERSYGGRYYFVDTMEVGKYLIYDKGSLRVGEVDLWRMNGTSMDGPSSF